MYESWKHAKGMKPMTKDGHSLWLHSYEMSKTWGGKTWEKRKGKAEVTQDKEEKETKMKKGSSEFCFVLFCFSHETHT